MRAALRTAQHDRQSHAVTALRETLAALDNAEAVAPGAAPALSGDAFSGNIAGSVAGLGAAEVPRLALTPEAATAVFERELQERREAQATYAAHGRHEEARALQLQLDVLEALR